MGKRSSRSLFTSSENLAIGGSVLSRGAGSVNCSKDDESFSCLLNQGVQNLQNMVFVVGVMYFMYYGYKKR